ncbi:Aminopeptidase YpdF (MP-, MA-, MS-, AP-, NP- specific) [Levilactobacillus brevis]|nr:Aminopeptidase YpdF (MP-, MA-, MS-, AP-, NP- specific) [Levilactobacillus brevis]
MGSSFFRKIRSGVGSMATRVERLQALFAPLSIDSFWCLHLVISNIWLALV